MPYNTSSQFKIINTYYLEFTGCMELIFIMPIVLLNSGLRYISYLVRRKNEGMWSNNSGDAKIVREVK